MNILEMFEEIVRKYPNKIAVADSESKISFNELKNKSIQLSKNISIIGENEAIGVVVNRSVRSIISIIAVLYSGNYYIPLDPKMPAEKKKSILDETGMKIILTDRNDSGCLLETNYNKNIIYVDELIDIEENFDKTGIIEINDYNGDNPLYMVYTSGSTGRPKGVLKSHESMDNFMRTYIDKFSFTHETVIGNQSPFFFDAAAKDIYMMMYTGATLEIIPSLLFSMPYKLIEYLNERKVNFISWVPSVLSIIVQLDTFNDIKPTYLKKVFFVGETFPIKHLKKWLEKLPDIQYVNLFGSSEIAGIFATYEVKELDDQIDMLPIGKPLDNCEVYLVGENGIVNQSEQLGEMVISSKAIALCYYNDPVNTSKKFIETNIYTGKMQRFFKTGDIAKYDAQGNLVFVTRKDFQIKKMGYRIELGEIEAIANKFEPIKLCCAVYNQEKKKIVLYCEVSNSLITKLEIKKFLKENLSDYMMPDKIVILNKIPLNANGKIDRAYLKSIS